MMPFRRFLLVASPLLLPFCASAQTESGITATMPNVVITTDREPVPADKVTGTVTVISRDEIERRQLRTVDEVLRYVPGVSVQQSGGPGTQTSVFVRGSNSNHTVVLVDGMSITDPSTPNASIDFAHFLTDNLDRIEVVRGPMSTLYGSGAIGGVINMVTKKGQGSLSAGGYAELGTRLQTSLGAYATGSVNRFNYNVSASGLYTPGQSAIPPRFIASDGYFDNDAYRNINLAARLGVDITENASLTWFGRYIDTQVKFDNYALQPDFTFAPAEDPNATEFTQQFFNRLQFDGNFFGGVWKPTIGVGYSTVYRHALDYPSIQIPFPAPMNSTYNGRQFSADWKNVFTITEQASIVAGIDYSNQWAYSNADTVQQWGQVSQTGLYAQGRVTLFEALTLSAGGRVDFNSLYGSNGTWRVGANYLLSATNTTFKASYGTAFKAPSLNQLYNAGLFCVGNRNLQPETSRGFEVGAEQTMFDGKVKAGVLYFKNNISNLIDCVTPFTQYTNVAPQAQTEGTESFVDIQVTDWLDVHFAYTHTLAFNLTTGAWLVRRPEDVFSVRAAVRPIEGVRLGAELNSVGGRHDLDAVTFTPITPPPYTLLRATAAWDVRKGVELFARAENILDQRYEEPTGFQPPAFQAFFGVKAKF
ncbi:TonB-dependent receptor plug domain-containing protein [Reyranella sp.]|uniref:TonB-dependent receptor plug domain-containing protein n=1 Tax=Reyranella sp. TaxID=1929291 RepID=UPI003D0F635A